MDISSKSSDISRHGCVSRGFSVAQQWFWARTALATLELEAGGERQPALPMVREKGDSALNSGLFGSTNHNFVYQIILSR